MTGKKKRLMVPKARGPHRSSKRGKHSSDTEEEGVDLLPAYKNSTKKIGMARAGRGDYSSDESEDVTLTSLKARSRGGTVGEREAATNPAESAIARMPLESAKMSIEEESEDDESGPDEELEPGASKRAGGNSAVDTTKVRMNKIIHHLGALNEVAGPELAQCLVSGGAMEDYNKVMKKEGLIEVEESLRLRVEKIGRDVVFDHLKFSSALNADLFTFNGVVMEMVVHSLRMDASRVNEVLWAEWCAAVKKGLADRRNGCRNNLREELRCKTGVATGTVIRVCVV
jgi:hypothetical protein